MCELHMALVAGAVDAGRMRKIYKRSDRAALIAAVKRGEPVPTAARRLHVTMSTAYRWARRPPGEVPASAAGVPTFLEVVAAGVPSGAVVVRVGAAQIEVRAGFDAELLRAVIAALEGASA